MTKTVGSNSMAGLAVQNLIWLKCCPFSPLTATVQGITISPSDKTTKTALPVSLLYCKVIQYEYSAGTILHYSYLISYHTVPISCTYHMPLQYVPTFLSQTVLIIITILSHVYSTAVQYRCVLIPRLPLLAFPLPSLSTPFLYPHSNRHPYIEGAVPHTNTQLYCTVLLHD